MANYYASCRTNYFKVKDVNAFQADIESIPGIDVIVGSESICILGDDPDGAGWPAWIHDEETGEDIEIDFFQEVAKHLADGEVAIFMEAGAEKLRYITGFALAINNKGEMETISLQNIYDLAKNLTDRPEDIESAEY